MDPSLYEQALAEAQKRGLLNGDKAITTEEMKKLEAGFKDPEFCKLFSQYYDEISDPKARKEQEDYIKQLEQQGEIPEGKELIHPQPGFVIKVHKLSSRNLHGKSKAAAPQQQGGGSKEKLFVNIVTSEKIGKPTVEKTAKGESWSIPNLCGPVRMEKDKAGANAPTFDCCFHPNALVHAQLNPRYKDLIAQIALEGVVKRYREDGQEVELTKEYHQVKGLNYKTGNASGNPETIMVPKDPFKAGGKGTSKLAAMAAANKKAENVSSTTKSSTTTTAPAAVAAKTPKVSEVPPSGDKTKAKPVSKPEPPTPPPSSGPVPPKYSIIERGQIDLTDHMMGEAGAPKATSRRPKELVVKIEVPLVRSAAELELDINERELVLSSCDRSIYKLSLRLPYPVIDEKGGAKFDKGKKILTVTIPVSRKDVDLPRPPVPVPSAPGVVEEISEKEKQEVGKEARQAKVKEEGKEHNRWVEQGESSADRLVLDQSEVAKAVAKAKEEAEEKKKQQTAAATKDVKPGVGLAEEKKVSKPKDDWKVDGKLDFNPSERFRGAQAGYIFKKDTQGIGYYRDGKSSSSSTTAPTKISASKAPPTTTSVTPRDDAKTPTFRSQQMEDIFSVIVNVKYVDPSSVKADWGGKDSTKVKVEFNACPPGSTNPIPYRLTLNLYDAIRPEACKCDPGSANMLVKLYKAKPGIMWPDLEASSSSSASKPAAASTTTTTTTTTKKDAGVASIRSASKATTTTSAAPAVATFKNRVMFELD